MRSEDVIRKRLDMLRKQRVSVGSYSEQKTIVWHAAKQALEWVLQEKETPLTF